MSDYILLGVFALVGLMFGGGAMAVSRLFAPKFPDQGKKLQSYESGEDAIGSARVRFKLGYYLFALVFLVFDVEALFLFPVLSVLREAGAGAYVGGSGALSAGWILLEVGLFAAVLAFALAYASRKKALEWE